jgi:glycosyltransferase involved in cell wall biosynthesis
MKRIGIIARMDKTGLGIQSKEFFDHIPCKALVIDVSAINNTIPQRPEWYPDQTIYRIQQMSMIPREVIAEFISDIDVLVTFENPYDYWIFDICRAKGIRTILQLNYEFLEYPSALPKPDLFLAPSMWHYDDIPDPKMFLPVPVATEKFTANRKPKTFVHIIGREAAHDRNGTKTILSSLKYIQNDITLIFKSQLPYFVTGNLPERVHIETEFFNKEHYWENFTGGVLVMPRRYGGLCLPMNESLAAGMPVITTDISPNHTWLPKKWLVPATKQYSFRCKKEVDVYEADAEKLAEKIDEFCDETFYDAAMVKSKKISECISWEKMLPKYLNVLNQ